MQQGNELHDLATFFLNTFLVEILIDVWANTTFLKKKQKLYGSFLWTGFNCLKARATSRRQYSFYQPRKDERLSPPWSHPPVLNTGPLDWESSTLTTRPISTIADNNVHPVTYLQYVVVTTSEFPDDLCVSELYPC